MATAFCQSSNSALGSSLRMYPPKLSVPLVPNSCAATPRVLGGVGSVAGTTGVGEPHVIRGKRSRSGIGLVPLWLRSGTILTQPAVQPHDFPLTLSAGGPHGLS